MSPVKAVARFLSARSSTPQGSNLVSSATPKPLRVLERVLALEAGTARSTGNQGRKCNTELLRLLPKITAWMSLLLRGLSAALARKGGLDEGMKRYLPIECLSDGENVILLVEGERVVLTLSMAEKVAVRILNLVQHMRGMKDERGKMGSAKRRSCKTG
jgi:hypothetical protein